MKTSATLTLVVAALFGSGAASAQYLWQAQEAATAKSAPKPSAVEATRDAGLTAFIDPATGQLRPPEREELQAIDRAARAAAANAPPITLLSSPSGAQGVLLNRSFDSYFVARKTADGTLDIECIPVESDALSAMATPVKTVGMVQKKVVLDEK